MGSIALFAVGGALGGLLLGMIGVGTALIAVPLLILALPWLGVPAALAPLTALGTSMAVVAVTSVMSVRTHQRLGNIDWRVVRLSVVPSLLGVAGGSAIAGHLPAALLRAAFAVFMIHSAWRMVRRPGAAVAVPTVSPTAPLARLPYMLGGGLIGFLGSLIGAGGGIFMVPFLGGRGHPMKTAVATSTAAGLPVTVIGALIYVGLGLGAGVDAAAQVGYLHLPAFFALSVTSMAMAPVGARLASRVPAGALKRAFAVVLVILAGKLLLG